MAIANEPSKPPRMTVLQARAIVEREALGPRENYLRIAIGSLTMILPYDAGMLMVESWRAAERLSSSSWGDDKHGIYPINPEEINVSPFSRKDYERFKMAMLMGVTYQEVCAAEQGIVGDPA